jgi:hypothetical protein
MPKLTLEGCVFNHYSAQDTTYAISLSKNAELVMDNTHVNIPNGIVIRLHNAYSTGGSTIDYVSYDLMKLTVTNSYFNASELYVIEHITASQQVENGPVSYSSSAVVYSSKIFDESFKDRLDESRQQLVLEMAEKLKLGEGTKTTFANVPDANIADGCARARQNDASAPYVFTSNYANVTWTAGDKSITECWVKGSVPTADNKDVKNNLATLNESVEAGYKYSYSAGKVDGDATFTATKFRSFSIKMSLTLAASMQVNVFVEIRDDVKVHSISLDGKGAAYTVMTLPDGNDYYRITISGVLPTTAADSHELEIYVDDANGVKAPVRIHFSVLDYIEEILDNEDYYGREARGLMANILNYIDTAYRYAGLTERSEYKTVKTLATRYENKITYSVVKNEPAPDLSKVTDALTSVQVKLDDAPKFRFNIAEGYTGRIKLDFTLYGTSVTREFNVVNGKETSKGLSYIDISLNAYDFRTNIKITTAGGTGVYNLQTYYNAMAGTDSSLAALLNALYAYSEKAEEYKRLSK